MRLLFLPYFLSFFQDVVLFKRLFHSRGAPSANSPAVSSAIADAQRPAPEVHSSRTAKCGRW